MSPVPAPRPARCAGRRPLGVRLLATWWIAAALLAPAAPGHAEATELNLQAAFLFKFTQYAQWPEGTLGPAGTPLEICVLGDRELAEVLRKAVSGRKTREHPLHVRTPEADGEVAGCHVLFVGLENAERAERTLRVVADSPTLTVGKLDGFAERGGMINLAKAGKRLSFEINRGAVERAGLRLSSHLLKLARIVDQEQGN